MAGEQRVRLFRDGSDQLVRIPREFELSGEEALLRKEGSRLILEPVIRRSLVRLLEDLEPIDDDFGPIPDPSADPID
jgi:antitoxin VapB